MKTQQQLMQSLKQLLDEELSPRKQQGDTDAIIEWAFGQALYDYMSEGNQLSDLPFFAATTYYTGSRPQAAA